MELLVPDADAVNDNDCGVDGFSEVGEGEAIKDAVAETITTVDAFARAKVANFIKRMSTGADVPSSPSTGCSSALSSSSNLAAEVREVQTAGDDEALFHARLRVPLPAEYGERWGEGLAPTEKEAELVAAMHAERVIDAMGFPMFQLTSKQKRHAEAARSAGRWAPMPGEDPRPPTTPSPPRLQLLREGETKAAERRLQIDKMEFLNVTTGAFTPMKLTLASPFFLDYGSVYRVKQFFAAYNCNIQRYSRVTALHKCNNKMDSGASSFSSSSDANKMFVAQLRLPIDARFGERIACGKSPSKKEAITLACMHAELIIDALGLALYPQSRERQEAHAEECRKVNRWCSRPGECDYHYTRASPPPLQLAKQNSVTTTAEEVDSTTSVESVLLAHARAIESYTNVTEISALVPSARRDFMDYIARHRTGASDSGSPFFVESLGVKDHEVYRATATVPVPMVTCGKDSTQSVDDNPSGAHDGVLPSFVAIGIGTSEVVAETAASMHALSVLGRLNCQLSDSKTCAGTDGRPQKPLTRDAVIPPPYRHVVAHIGRIMVPGLSPGRTLGALSATGRRRDSSAGRQELRLRGARAELPERDWSLEADAEGYIIMDPSVNIQEGRNYVHTLPSVRQADRFAIVRLRDYLERHGKRLETTVSSVCLETDEGLKRWVKKVTLPVPEAFGHVVAHGEAYTEDEALVMCAVHAELLLDELGVALYDLDALQEKHCVAAEMLGRWAPYKTQAARRAVSTPPPVRKEHANSCLWACLSKKAMKQHTCSSGKTLRGTEPATHLTNEKKDTKIREASESNLTATTTKSEGSTAMPPSVGEKITDDALCDLEGLTSVHASEFFFHAPRLLDVYCRRKGVDISRLMRQYSVRNPAHGLVHRAILELPVPPQFGRRYAVGCALAKKEAYVLCCMHAVYILGELGIPVYIGPKQTEFAAMARLKGRYAPGPGDPLRPGSTKSPPGLKSLSDAHMSKPLAPTPPDRVKCRKPFVWENYVKACRVHIQKLKEQVIFDALFVQGKAPRSGVDVEDNGLDAVEALPLFTNVKSRLAQKCAAAGLPPPPPMSFRFEVHGRQPQRRYLVEQPVLGTPFVARGMGEEGQEAVTRAAMHYEYLLAIISGTQERWGGPGLMSRNGHSDLFDPALRDFTPRGKLSIMALYTMVRAPFAPLRLTVKERCGATAEAPLVYVSLVEMEDESGLRMAGKGEDRANAEEARNRAIAELYKQLQRKSTFQTVAQLVHMHLALRPEGAAHLCSEKMIMTELRSVLAEHEKSPPQPLLAASHELSEWCGVACLLRKGADHWDSSELRLLCDLAERALGASKTPAPLTLPVAARRLLTTMGLVSTHGTDEALKDSVEVNAMGVMTALFALCLPRPVVCRGSALLASGALSLQLAKLLLAGSLMNCLQLSVRVAALVLFSVNGQNNDLENNDLCNGGDVLELVSHALPHGAQQFAATISVRLRELFSQLSKHAPASSALEALVGSLCISVDDVWGSFQEGLTPTNEARLRLAIAFATFPRAFVQKKAATKDVSCMVTLESKDCQRTAHVVVPPALVESHNLSSCATSSSSSLSSLPSCHSFFPCFCAFHSDIRCEVATEKEAALFGTFLSPCGLLLASATCDDSRVVVVSEEVSNMALVDGFFPVVMRSSESLAALVELRLALKRHWTALRPLPDDVQRVVDKLLLARHSLTNIVGAELLV